MTPEQLGYVVRDMFPYIYPKSAKKNLRGLADVRRPAKDAYKKFGSIVGVTSRTVIAWTTGKIPIPKWMAVAVNGMGIGPVPGAQAGVSMINTPVEMPITLKATAIHLYGKIVAIKIDNPFLSDEDFDPVKILIDTPVSEHARGGFASYNGKNDLT